MLVWNLLNELLRNHCLKRVLRLFASDRVILLGLVSDVLGFRLHFFGSLKNGPSSSSTTLLVDNTIIVDLVVEQ